MVDVRAVDLSEELKSVYESERREDRVALVHAPHFIQAPNLVLGFSMLCLFMPICIPILAIYLNKLFGNESRKTLAQIKQEKEEHIPYEGEAPKEQYYLAQALEDELDQMLKDAEKQYFCVDSLKCRVQCEGERNYAVK